MHANHHALSLTNIFICIVRCIIRYLIIKYIRHNECVDHCMFNLIFFYEYLISSKMRGIIAKTNRRLPPHFHSCMSLHNRFES